MPASQSQMAFRQQAMKVCKSSMVVSLIWPDSIDRWPKI